jgi:hypothetical protein
VELEAVGQNLFEVIVAVERKKREARIPANLR